MNKIIHVDMDCFYAAVEVKYNPNLRGKPLGIGGPPNTRSVLCTASYEARKFGVRSAMPSSQAVKLCPQLILIPPHFELYKKESAAVRAIFERFTDKIEPLSLDEAYLDVTECSAFGGSATLIAQEIRRMIFDELQLTASAGVAPNKFLAKVASDWNKPNGQFVIRPDQVDSFVQPLLIEKIFGVGKVTAKKMHELGLYTCGDLQKLSLRELNKYFGSRGDEFYNLSRGIDQRIVETSNERKSLTVEETFDKDISDIEQIKSHIPALYEEWESRMQKTEESDRIRGFVAKVKYFDFQSKTREISCRDWPTQKDFEILIEKLLERRNAPIRLLGLGVKLGSNNEQADVVESPQLSFAI